MSNLHKQLLHQKVTRLQPREVDVTMDILNILLKERADSPFVKSLHQQYCERGGLSKKQLEAKVKEVPPQKLAALEAIIKLKTTRNKSSLPELKKEEEKDEASEKMIDEILVKYPQHKRVLFLQTMFNRNRMLSSTEKEELKKFYKLLIK